MRNSALSRFVTRTPDFKRKSMSLSGINTFRVPPVFFPFIYTEMLVMQCLRNIGNLINSCFCSFMHCVYNILIININTGLNKISGCTYNSINIKIRLWF